MVFMTMGNQDSAQLVLVFQNIRIVGKHEVNARLLVIGKHKAGIDKNHIITVLKDGHVFTNAV